METCVKKGICHGSHTLPQVAKPGIIGLLIFTCTSDELRQSPPLSSSVLLRPESREDWPHKVTSHCHWPTTLKFLLNLSWLLPIISSSLQASWPWQTELSSSWHRARNTQGDITLSLANNFKISTKFVLAPPHHFLFSPG